ncbi:MAG: hypothetical protein H0X01_10365 [Nitrospira sp.]|nr:hypothetical protein [Nitrospira sp.]
MTPTIQAIAVPVLLNLAYVQPMTFDRTTAMSIVIEGSEQRPTAMFNSQQATSATMPLDWLEFAISTLPNAQPLTPAERSSVNEFFWSQFN